MNGMEKIAQRIQGDAQKELDQLEAETRRQAEELLAQTRAQAGQEREAILARGKKAAAERQERLESAAQMEKRKLTLAAKQEILDQVFDRALEKLCALPEEELIPMLSRLAAQASASRKEQVIFSKRDRARLGKQVVLGANEILAQKNAGALPGSIGESKMGAFINKIVGVGAQLTLSQDTRNIQGGLILSDGEIEMNCTFETLVRLQREKLEREIAGILFENE